MYICGDTHICTQTYKSTSKTSTVFELCRDDLGTYRIQLSVYIYVGVHIHAIILFGMYI